MISNTIDDRLSSVLTSVLKGTELHKSASNEYYAIPSDYGDDIKNIKVVFLIRGVDKDELSVYLVYEPCQLAMLLDDYISKGDMQKLLQQLNERVKNKKRKLLSNADFDKISLLLKQKYNKANDTKKEEINDYFAYILFEIFRDIPGKKTHIGYVDASMLYGFFRSKHYDSLFEKSKQRGA